MRQVAQLLLMCDRHDIGISIEAAVAAAAPSTASSGRVATRPGGGWSAGQAAQIFIYDNYPGGIGFSEPLFRMHDELLAATRKLIAGCECESGCPGCVGPIGNTGPLAKAAALRILDLLIAPAFAPSATARQALNAEEAPF
jgi:DEAD/DEAH box helicase domain-containing protein